MFQWYPTSSNRVPLNRQGHVARMFLVCQISVFEPFCTWTVHCTLEFRRRMVQPSAQRCDRHQNRSGYFPPLPLPMKPVGPELQLVGGRPSRVIVLEQRWMLIYFIYYESWENPVGLDSWCYEEAGATTQPSILSAGWSHAISVPCSNNRLRLRCITCADAHVRLPLLPGCCDHGITRWIVGSKNSWRMLEVTAAKLLQLKSIEVQYRCWDTIIFYSQMKCFFVCFFWLFDVFLDWSCIFLVLHRAIPQEFEKYSQCGFGALHMGCQIDDPEALQAERQLSSQFRVPKAWTCYDILWFKWRIQCPWLSQFWPILSMMIHESLEISRGAIRFVDPHRVAGWTWPVAGVIGRPWCCLCSDWKKLAMWWVAWRPFGNGLPQFWAL